MEDVEEVGVVILVAVGEVELEGLDKLKVERAAMGEEGCKRISLVKIREGNFGSTGEWIPIFEERRQRWRMP